VRAVRLHADGLRVEELELPALREGDALVRVRAAAITRGELEWPVDRLPAIPSYELSGVVADTGEEVFALTPFDRDGAAAEYVVVPAQLLAPKPRALDHIESAAVPLPALSAWQGLFDHGALKAGQRVLVTGATGGVGHLAVQLAEHAGAVDATEDVDLVFDTAGGESLARAAQLIRPGGRIVTVAEEPPDAFEATYFVVEPNRAQLAEIAGLVDAGELRPAIDSVFPLAEAEAAFERTRARDKRGKVVLDVADE
jgi:NADPH:quinone reductase-like Zn-dependent oxidoreductase